MTSNPSESGQDHHRTAKAGGGKEEQLYLASQWQLMWWKFIKHRLAVISGIVILLMYLMAVFAPFLTPNDPAERDTNLLYAPPTRLYFQDEQGGSLRPFVYAWDQSFDRENFQRVFTEDRSQKYNLQFLVHGHEYSLFFGLVKTDLHLFGVDGGGKICLFGFDELGRDLYTRTIYASQISLTIGLAGVLLSLILGVVLGGISGFFGGTVDILIQRFAELLRSFPSVPLWLTLSAAMPPGWPPQKIYFGITIILSFIAWTNLARVVRGKILQLKEEDFVLAARFAGAKTGRIIFRHLIPSFTSHIIAAVTLAIPGMIIGETSLSFLGLGLRSPVMSWGVLLQQAQSIFTVANAPWLMTPGIFVVVIVLAFNFLGDGLRDAADPYTSG